MTIYHPIDSNTPGDPMRVSDFEAKYYLKKGFVKEPITDKEILEYYKAEYGSELLQMLMGGLPGQDGIPSVFFNRPSMQKYVNPSVLEYWYGHILEEETEWPPPELKELMQDEVPKKKGSKK